MKLDPLSQTLITDWASDVLGRPMHGRVVAKMASWLDYKIDQFRSSTIKLAPSPPSPGVRLWIKKQKDENLRYFISYQNGQIIDLGTTSLHFSREQRARKLIYKLKEATTRLEKFKTAGQPIQDIKNKPLLHCFPIGKGQTKRNTPILDYRFEADQKLNLVLEHFQIVLKRETHGNQPSSNDIAALKNDFPRLARLLRNAFRGPEIAVLREALSIADRDALIVMRRIHDFDMQLYGYMTGSHDAEICKRRRQFVASFPALSRFTFAKGAPEDHLRKMVDEAYPLLRGEGIAAIIGVLSAEHKLDISRPTAVAYAKLRPLSVGRTMFAVLTEWLPPLDAVDPVLWPHTISEANEFIEHVKPLKSYPAAARRLVRDNASDWAGLYRKEEGAIQTQLSLAAEDELYRNEQRARIAGENPHYAFPYPLPVMKEKRSVIVQRHVRDYLNEIINQVIKPTYLAVKQAAVDEAGIGKIFCTLMAAAPFRQLIEVSEKWHEPRRMRRLQAELQRLNPGLEKGWLPLIAPVVIPEGTVFNGQDIGGLRFDELTTPSQLTADSEEKGHCVYTYVRHCLSASIPTHIFALGDEQGRPVSTVEMTERIRKKAKVKLGQNLTYGDQLPGPRAIAAGQWLEEQINSGKIKLLHTFAAREARRTELRAEDAKRVAQIAEDPVLLQATFDLVRSAIFPSAWKQYRTPQEFLPVALGETAAEPTPIQPQRNSIEAMPRASAQAVHRAGLT